MRNAETDSLSSRMTNSGQENTGKPDDAKVSSPVWGEAEGEGLLTQYLACGLLHRANWPKPNIDAVG